MPATAGPTSLRSRLRLALAALAALAGLVALVALAAVEHNRRLEDRRQDVIEPAERAAESLRRALVDQQTAARGFVITADESFLARYDSAVAAESAALTELDALLGDDPDVADATSDVARQAAQWRAVGAEPEIAAVRAGDREQAASLVAEGPGREAFVELRAQLDRLHDTIAAEADALGDRLVRATTIVAVVTVGGAVVLAVSAFVVGLLLARWLTRPLGRVAAAVTRVSEGELGEAVPIDGPAEIAQVGQGVERMRQRLLHELDEARHTSVVETEQRERRRLAGELHDDPVQALAAAQLRLQALRPFLAPEEGVLVDEVVGALSGVQARLRSVMFRLHPPALDQAGLVAAVEDLLEESFPEGGVRTEVLCAGCTEPPPVVAAVAYRGVAEAVRNVARHACASSVSVLLEGNDRGIGVSVVDDGIGFSPDRPVTAEHGLGIAADTVRGAGGRWEVVSEPGEGTRVRFWVPVR